MNKIKYLLVFTALLSIGLLFAQPCTVRFYDSSGTNQTKAALDLEAIPLLGAPYTSSFPTSANRWRFQWYKDGGDGVISPLDPVTHGPTGDDELAVGNVTPGNTQGVVGLAPTGAWSPAAAGFDPVGSALGNTHQGDRVFIRIFNHNQIAMATKSMAFTALYTITTTTNQTISPFVPSYAWGPWEPFEEPEPMIEPDETEAIAAPAGMPVPGVNVFSPPESFFDIFYEVVEYDSLPVFPPNSACDGTNTFGLMLYADEGDDPWAANLTFSPMMEPEYYGPWWVKYYWEGIWYHGIPYPAMAPGPIQLPGVPIGAAGVEVIIYYGPEDPDLPVELSSFTAIYAAGFFVELTWVVESETNHLGYYVLRNNSREMSTALTMNTSPITSGSANGTQITYNLRDDELDGDNTYYYWLESVDLDGSSQFFGPISVVVGEEGEENVIPVVPMVTALGNAYPNPFTGSTRFNYTLDKAASVKIEIFNVKGQLVRSFSNEGKAGVNWQTWDGKDSNGKSVNSGIYYYRMSSGKYTASKKIVLVK